ncbi:MAG: DNA cytosine methyltransferase [Aestuariivita sp.]|nr:DNA cytosine methyltransferase [Aestuariivita sp.]MCY4346982.1 DNA cytosine methyltransferase [Aestuariivita sp.]
MIGIDLFAGAGGFSLGAVRSGIKVVVAIESDHNAVTTYRTNHRSCSIISTDIRDISDDQIRSIPKGNSYSIVFGGPPCQGFSHSNSRTRNIHNPKNWLFREFVRFVRVWEPDFILLENVRGIIDAAEGKFLSAILTHFSSLRYQFSHGALNAKNYGVPQNRSRFFLLGAKDIDPISLPKKKHAKPLTVRDAISDLPVLENGASISWMPYGKDQTSSYASSLRLGAEHSPNHLVTRNAQYIVDRYQHVPQGGNWRDIPHHLMQNYKDFTRCHTGIYYRLHLDEPSTVIGNYRKNMLIHPTQNRGLSVREAARIQSFPDSYEFFGSIGFQQQQVGNAVPPLLAETVFSHLLLQVYK